MNRKKQKILEQKDSIVQDFINCFPKRYKPLVTALIKQNLIGLYTMRDYVIVTSIKTLQWKMNYTYSMSILEQSNKYSITTRRIRRIYEKNRQFKLLNIPK